MENKFKRGEVYKSLARIVRPDPDFMEAPTVLFDENELYKCKKDGTLYSFGSFSDENINKEFFDDFVLVGHFTPEIDAIEMRKMAMKPAFEKSVESGYDFDTFYRLYREEFKIIHEEDEKINDNIVTFLNGETASYYDVYKKGDKF